MAEWVIKGSDLTVTANTSDLKAPNASSNATKVVRNNAEAYIYRANELTCESVTPYTVSTFVKLDGVERAVLRIGQDDLDNYVEVTYDVANNFIVDGPKAKGDLVTSNYNARMIAIGDGWYALLAQIEFYEEVDLNIYFTLRDGNVGLKGNDTQDLSQIGYFWNPKIERRSIDNNTGFLGSGNSDILNIPEDTYYHVPIWSADTNVISYIKKDGTLRNVTPTTLLDFSTETAIEYIRLPITRSDGFPTQFIVEDTLGRSKTLNIAREDFYTKYEPHAIHFVNKNGVIDVIWFIRKSEYMMKSTSDMYYKNLINYDTMSFDQHDHSHRKFNIVSTKSVTLNTGNIPESVNVALEEMQNSEQVWMQNNSGTFPVNVKGEMFKYKTHTNDKLVQYSFTFEFANRIDNTIV